MDGFENRFDVAPDTRGRIPLGVIPGGPSPRYFVSTDPDGRVLLVPTHLVGDLCGVDGCGRLKATSRAYCILHYKRSVTHGDPDVTKIPTRGSSVYDALMQRSEDGAVPERFWDGEGYSPPPPGTSPCRVWTTRVTRGGYGQFRGTGAHRVMWEDEFGSCGDLVIDHLCLNKACINVAHLEAVTNSVNAIRRDRMSPPKTHCVQGHEFTEANTYYNPKDGSRSCLTCRRRRTAESNAARKAAKTEVKV